MASNPTCRPINPAKSEIGKISKELLDRINTALVSKLKLNQWKNSEAVLAWFTGIQHKELHTFIAFDVVEFYPSISIDLLGAALEFASKLSVSPFATTNGILSFRQKVLFSTLR